MHVGLTCGDGYHNPEVALETIRSFFHPSDAKPEPPEDGKIRLFADLGEGRIRSAITSRFAELACLSGDVERLSVLEKLLTDSTTSIGIWDEVLAALRANGQKEMARRLSELHHERWGRVSMPFEPEETKRADRLALESILRVCGPAKGAITASARLPTIGLLIAGMDWMSSMAWEWERFGKLKDIAIVDAVFRGCIDSFGLSKEQLAAEADWALTNLESLHGRDRRYFTMGLLEAVSPVSPSEDWKRAAREAHDGELLFRALAHPIGPIRNGAAGILAYGGGGAIVDKLLVVALNESDSERLLSLAAPVAATRWGSPAIAVFVDALRGREPSRASAQMLQPLSKLMKAFPGSEFFEPFIGALHSKETRVATAAAEALENFDKLPAPVVAELHAALTRRWPASEPSGENSQLLLTTPGGSLVRMLLRLNEISRERLIQLTQHGDGGASNVATTEVLRDPSPDELRGFVQDVSTGVRTTHFLKQMLTNVPPDRLSVVADDLLRLLSAPSHDVRLAILDSLPLAKWITKATAQESARGATKDADAEVRSRAARILRMLE